MQNKHLSLIQFNTVLVQIDRGLSSSNALTEQYRYKKQNENKIDLSLQVDLISKSY